ncbi:hypothetical protein [Variovorax sp. J31P207]|uniref:hypothetical protein n=1 Tax=Variovorax sp. J31P207 TaxID=3053510 RepID=UPI0025790E60|nr:hypothetical protein [Variovorax sp. J31P207]MDM0066656.1 hypothetical protein [Variovorax sp. J31P207]
MVPFLVSVLLAGLLAGCGGGGDGGAGSVAVANVGQSVETPAVGSVKGQSAKALRKPDEDASLCTVEIYGDSIMALNGTSETPVMTLQRIRPNLVFTDHSVQGMRLLAGHDARLAHYELHGHSGSSGLIVNASRSSIGRGGVVEQTTPLRV